MVATPETGTPSGAKEEDEGEREDEEEEGLPARSAAPTGSAAAPEAR